jgi:hypothetical protein
VGQIQLKPFISDGQPGNALGETELAFIVNPAPFHKFVTRDTKSGLSHQWLTVI